MLYILAFDIALVFVTDQWSDHVHPLKWSLAITLQVSVQTAGSENVYVFVCGHCSWELDLKLEMAKIILIFLHHS